MKSSVIIFPGSNCDMDMIYVLKTIMKQEVIKLWHKDTDLQEVDFIIITGGFSYGDYLRAGCMAAQSPVVGAVRDTAARGVAVLGVCTGFHRQLHCAAAQYSNAPA